MGTNSDQATQAISQGMDMIEDLTGRMSRDRDEADAARGQARLLETDARGEAHDAQRRAAMEARRLRRENERDRSAERARWGGSNLDMSGSKTLVRDARRLQDRQEEDDVLFEGQQSAESILGSARNRANMLRINSGASANRSILSLGSSIYGPRR